MTLIDYLKAKYPSGNFGIMACECKAFGIKYPLQNGWLQKHQNDEISAAQIRELKSLLRKRDKEINKRTLEFLEREFVDDHIKLVKGIIARMDWNMPQEKSYSEAMTFQIGTPIGCDKPDKFTAQITAFKQLKEKRNA